MAARLVVLSSVVLLLLTSAGCVVILQVQAMRARLSARIVRATAPYHLRPGSTNSDAGLAISQTSQGLATLLAAAFGFNPASQDHYLLRWWIALPIALLAALAAAWVAAGLLSPWMLLTAPLIWIVLSRGFFKWCLARRREKLFVQFPDALAMIVRAVRVGIPVSDAIRSVGRELAPPTGPEFARLTDELSIGVVLTDAVQAMSQRVGLREYYFFATAMSLQNQTGGGLSETLENLADVIRRRVAVRQRGRALSAEAQTSALVLALLPPMAAAALWLMSPDYIIVLFTDPAGRKILGLAVGSLACGVLTMRFLIRRSLR